MYNTIPPQLKDPRHYDNNAAQFLCRRAGAKASQDTRAVQNECVRFFMISALTCRSLAGYMACALIKRRLSKASVECIIVHVFLLNPWNSLRQEKDESGFSSVMGVL